MIQSSQKITALHCRLSQENMRQGDSDSIVNQKMILFADDGYSGVNFERPAFRRMLDLIEDGKIGVIITKDYCAIIGLNQKGLENTAFSSFVHLPLSSVKFRQVRFLPLDSKSVVPHGTVGSNPTVSAIKSL